MPAKKADIIIQLQKDILPLLGFKPILNSAPFEVGLGPIEDSFPNGLFPLGAVHEFCCAGSEDAAATGGFIAGVLAPLMRSGRTVIWISSSRMIFPPALTSFGISPDKIIFVDLQNERDILWVMEEALRYDGLAAVVGEIRELSFTASRRLQLAVEQSRVTGFILRLDPRNMNTTACITRWKITALPSEPENDLPGIGFPQWNVELLKVRNGRPGSWQLEWVNGSFRHVYPFVSITREQQKKTG